MPENKRRCEHCFKEITDPKRPKSKYCREACRVAASRARTRERRKTGALAMMDPPHVKKIKQLVFNDDDSEMANLVRAVFDDRVRQQIDNHIRDNLLGMTEALVDMAPEAIAALKEDLSSDDDYVRSRAYALFFKHVMPMWNKRDTEEDTAGGVTVVLATPFSQKVKDALDGREDAREAIDITDWPECYVCHKTKHEDAMYKHDERNGTTRWICRTCHWKRKAKSGDVNPTNVDDELFS